MAENTLVILQLCRWQVPQGLTRFKLMCWQSYTPFWRLQRRTFLVFSNFWRPPASLLMAPSTTVKTSSATSLWSCCHHHISLVPAILILLGEVLSLYGPMWLDWGHLDNPANTPHLRSLTEPHLQDPWPWGRASEDEVGYLWGSGLPLMVHCLH